MKTQLLAFALCAMTVSAVAQSKPAEPGSQLTGTWTLVAADKILPDGKEVPDYGADPEGIAVFTADGHYVVEIFRSDRTKFVSGDRAKGTADEYRDAVMSTSCHFGTYSVDTAKGMISFNVARASFPNWDDTTRTATYKLDGDKLAWRTPARPDGSIPVSVFRREQR
jgi:Lipocalin-like domain